MMMKLLSAIGSALGPALANHLWQSTLFALAAALLVLVLRKSQARVRYWLWLAASLKFLLPFSLLTGLGSHLAQTHKSVAQTQPAFYYAMDVASQPFTFASSSTPSAPLDAHFTPAASFIQHMPAIMTATWLCGIVFVLTLWWMRWRRIANVLKYAPAAQKGRELEALRRLERKEPGRRPLRLAIMDAVLEPGIFGIFQPVLVWPKGISERLSSAQIEAIIAHELWHVRRRDNLAAALHMVVKAIFWFHPLVWWIESRLLEERERACDEGVLQLCNEPRIYAESILKACEFCLERPLPCVAGVTGADLKKRIARIMTQNVAQRLSAGRKILLAVFSAIVVAGPVLFGFVNIPKLGAQLLQASANQPLPSFEVASVKPSHSSDNRRGIWINPGRFTVENASLKSIIMFAYDAKSDSQISGGPDWIKSETFNIDAKEDEAQAAELQKFPPEERDKRLRLMVQSLLAERFHLKVSRQTKELPVYALVVAKGGPKLTKSAAPPPSSDGQEAPSGQRPVRRGIRLSGRGDLSGMDAPIGMLAEVLSRQREAGGRVIIDKTGLTGNYDWTLHWTPESPAPLFKGADNASTPDNTPAPDTTGPTLFTALEEQLGLRLESQKGAVDTLVIDSVEKPSEN